MKLEAQTLNILKNFSTINPSLLVKEGNVLKTISPTKTILAKANVPNSFPKRFAIYELNKLLGGMSLMTNPNLDFNDNHIKISDPENGASARVMFSDESNIKAPPEKEIALPTVDVSFSLKHATLVEVVKAAGVFTLPQISVVGDGSKIYLQANEVKNPSSNTFEVEIGSTDKNFRAVFKTENLLKILSADYEVSISSKGLSHFKSDAVEYWIAVESDSTF